MKIVILGLSITSSWGNGHATTYRGLVRELDARGHDVMFLERDVAWYAENRDLPEPPFGRTELYRGLEELKDRFAGAVRDADVVILGSYVPEGVRVGNWVAATARGLFAFYDIDTPITIRKLREFDYEYVDPTVVSSLDLYLSFSGGPALDWIRRRFGVAETRPLYCSVDPQQYYPQELEPRWHLGYLGTYSLDRQPGLVRLMLKPATRWPEGRFVVAGPQYPDTIAWPESVERIEHLPPAGHREFYNRQRFTLSVTRAEMMRWGHSPSVRLFEAAACGTPVISDAWTGIERFFVPGRELLVARGPRDSLRYLRELGEEERRAIGDRARRRALAEHTAADRAEELDRTLTELLDRPARRRAMPAPSGREHAESRRSNRESRSAVRSDTDVRSGRADRSLRDQIEDLAPWFHNLHLPDGTQTAPDHRLGDFPRRKWEEVAPSLPADLEGWTALDIGCNAGFYAFELAARGARVTAVDHNPHYLEQARWAARFVNGSERVRFELRDIYELQHDPDSYDLVLFMGVFYHLRYPLLGLDLAARKARRLFVFQSMMMPAEEVDRPVEQMDYSDAERFERPGWPKMAFIEHRFAGDPTNWWVPNRACVESLLRSSGLAVVERAGRETYVCRPAAGNGREPWFAEARARATAAVLAGRSGD